MQVSSSQAPAGGMHEKPEDELMPDETLATLALDALLLAAMLAPEPDAALLPEVEAVPPAPPEPSDPSSSEGTVSEPVAQLAAATVTPIPIPSNRAANLCTAVSCSS